MKALVTGAGGFIGSHLVEHLLKQGLEVRAMLRYTSRPNVGDLTWIRPEFRSQIKIIRGDIKDPDFCREALKDIDYVFHLAALISIPYSYRNPTDYVLTNIVGTTHLLNAARQEGKLKRWVQTSTSEVYGTAQSTPIKESHPLNPQSPYAASKVGADAMAMSYHLSYGLPVSIIRPFNTYGPRQSARAVIPAIILQLLQGEKVVLGNLKPRRDFLYVKDTARGFYDVGLAEASLGQTCNLGTGFSISIGDLLKEISELMELSPSLQLDESLIRPVQSEVMALEADGQKAMDLSNWKAQYSLRQGLSESISWYKKHKDTLSTSPDWV